MRQLIIRTGAAIGLVLSVAQSSVAVAAEAPEQVTASGQYATFEGDIIDMSGDRSNAVACAITDSGNRCYRSEAAMDQAERSAPRSGARAANCSSSVRVYSGSSHTGSITSISTRGSWINLSASGADNTTSSYKIGSCSATFRSGQFGTGSNYPGTTSAGTQRTSMVSGWDNRVSSVLLS